MREKDISIRQIAKKLGHSRKTIRKVLAGAPPQYQRHKQIDAQIEPIIAEQFRLCQGNAVRVLENLSGDYNSDISYSTLTRHIRQLGLRDDRKKKRSGEYNFGPGDEFQHDTSPHKVFIDGKLKTAQCVSLVLAYSRKLFIQYTPAFTRFEAKCLLSRGLEFFDGSCPRCIVDNTSVVVANGSGANATIAPEMKAFGRFFDMQFKAHEIGHADRKPIVERNFSYAENNFLAGRTFSGWDDLNAQALNWCIQTANKKPKRSLGGMSPDEAYLMEKKYLNPLPAYIAPVYQTLYRIVDLTGYVNIDTNRYSVPENYVSKKVEVHKYWDRIHIYRKEKKIASHRRCIDKRYAKIKAPGHHRPYAGKKQRRRPLPEEIMLCGHNDWLDAYVAELKKRIRGVGRRKIAQLLELRRSYPRPAFDKAIEKAQKYGLYDLNRLEHLILSNVAGDFFNLYEGDQ